MVKLTSKGKHTVNRKLSTLKHDIRDSNHEKRRVQMHDIGNAFEIKRHSNLPYTYIRLIYDTTTYLILKTRQFILIHI